MEHPIIKNPKGNHMFKAENYPKQKFDKGKTSPMVQVCMQDTTPASPAQFNTFLHPIQFFLEDN